LGNELEGHEDRLLSTVLMYNCGNYFEEIRKQKKNPKKTLSPNSFTLNAPLLKNMRSYYSISRKWNSYPSMKPLALRRGK